MTKIMTMMMIIMMMMMTVMIRMMMMVIHKIESNHNDEGDDCHLYGSCQSIGLHTI